MEHNSQKHVPCASHPNGRPVSVCPGCGNTVCSECIKHFGYFCSEACRDAARAAEPEEDAAESHVDYTAAQQRYDDIARILFRRVPLALAALIALVVLLRWIDSTGEEQWRVTLPGSSGIARMIEVDDTLFVLHANGGVAALNTTTGEELWNRPSVTTGSSMTHMNGALYLDSLCLDASDGSTKWELEMREGVYNDIWKVSPEGIVGESTSYTSSSDEEDATWTLESEIQWVDPETGDVRWRRALDSQTVHQIGFFAGRPWCLTSNPHVESTTTFQLEALNPKDGRRAWGMRATSDEDPLILVTDEQLVVALPEEAIGMGTGGTKLWTEPLGQKPTLATQVQNQVVLCLAGTELRGLDAESGKTLWSTTVPGWVETVAAQDRRLYATVAGWGEKGEASQHPLESMRDGPEKQLLEELFFEDEDMEGEEDVPMFAEVDRVAAYDLRKGRLQWDERIGYGTVTPGPGCCYFLQSASGMGSLIGGDTTGRLIARAAPDGDVMWRFKSETELTSMAEGDQMVYLESTRNLPEMLSKYGGGSPPEISLVAVRKRGLLHRLTHW